jgi:pyruvate-formate lyase-activating enzyme
MTQYLELLTSRVSEGRQILVYGAGSQGRGVIHALRERGIEPAGFIDRNPAAQGRFLAGLPVLAPTVLTEPNSAEKLFIIIAAFFFEREISGFLESCGFIRNISYVAYSNLKPRDYAVEVSGICNLHCISCPRGEHRTSKRSTGMMSLDTFRKVITKIRREDPFVGNIQLYQWGEPTLNKDLPGMIRYARENGILCAISSNLNYQADFSDLIDSHPECIRISVSGTGDNYAITHTGGDWNTFVTNVERIAKLRRDLYPEMKVELYYHLYKHSLGDQQERVAEMCRRYDFEFHPVPAYLISLDDVLSYCEGKPLPNAAQRARELLLIDIDEGLGMAKAEATLDCDALRVVLVNTDLSVSTCMMYFDQVENTCADNFLEVTIEEIDARRQKAPLCVKCRKHGIHRYCGIYAKISEKIRY